MPVESKTKQIGEDTYDVAPLTAIKGRRVFVRLAKIVGPILGELSSADRTDAGRMLAAAAAHVNEDDVDFLCDAFAPSTTVIGKGALDKIFAVHFVGKYAAMFEWLAFCAEVNYADFFLELAKKSPDLKLGQTAPTP